MYPGGSAEKYGKNACVERLLQRLDMYNSGSGLGDGTPPNWQANEWVQKSEMTTKMGADQEWRIERRALTKSLFSVSTNTDIVLPIFR